MNLDVFTPVTNTIVLAATTSPATIALADPRTGADERVVRLVNAGSSTVFVAFGDLTATAAVPTAGAPASGFPVLAGQGPEPFRIPATATHVSAVCASGAATLYVTVGRGL